MNFKEWLDNNGVIAKWDLHGTEYKNLENILGKNFWICDYRLNYSKDAKPIRSISPRLVKVVDNDTGLPANKNVYYSPIHFREIKGDGKLSSTVIAPFDNTGHRGRTGVSVNIFDNEKQCIDCYLKQCDEAINMYKVELGRRTLEINLRILEIQELKDIYTT